MEAVTSENISSSNTSAIAEFCMQKDNFKLVVRTLLANTSCQGVFERAEIFSELDDLTLALMHKLVEWGLILSFYN